MSSEELTEWQAFDLLEPIGELRADIRAGQICSTFVNVMGGGRSKVTPADFLLYLDRGEPVAVEPLFDADPEAQSQLIMSAVFGVSPGS